MAFSISTPRLLLRDFQEEDWSAVHAYATDGEVTRFMDWGPNSEEETKAFVHQAMAGIHRQPREVYDLAVVFQPSGQVIGGVTLRLSREAKGTAELGYTLSRVAWGQGVGTELARALIDFGFSQLGLRRVWATCRPDNIGSYRVMRKAGMHFEEYLQNVKLVRGALVDAFLCGISREDWERLARTQGDLTALPRGAAPQG